MASEPVCGSRPCVAVLLKKFVNILLGNSPASEGLDHSPFLPEPVVSVSHGAAFPAPDASTGCWIQVVGTWLRGHVILRCHRGPRTRTVRRSVFFREMIPPLRASPLRATSAT